MNRDEHVAGADYRATLLELRLVRQELAELRRQREDAERALPRRLDDRIAVLAVARRVDPELDAAGRSDADIRRATMAARGFQVDRLSDEEIRGMFASLIGSTS